MPTATCNIYTSHQPLKFETQCSECVVWDIFFVWGYGYWVDYLLIRLHGVVVREFENIFLEVYENSRIYLILYY